MILNILDNTSELWMTKYIIGEIFSSGRATLYKNPSDQTVTNLLVITALSWKKLFNFLSPPSKGPLLSTTKAKVRYQGQE